MNQSPATWLGWRRFMGDHSQWACVVGGETEQEARDNLARYLARERRSGRCAVMLRGEGDPAAAGVVGQFYKNGLLIPDERFTER